MIEEENRDRDRDLEDSNRIENFMSENVLYKNSKLENLCLNFVIPGYEIEMIENGQNIILSANNIEEYIHVGMKIPVVKANPWINMISLEEIIPPISQEQALGYVTALGIALADIKHD